MGNWTEREVLNGSDPVEYFRHTPDARNRIAVLEHDSVNSPAGNTEPIYDEAGNLIFDGGYAYQYDAWNRLVQINTATMDTIPDQDPLQGEIEVLVVGGLIKHHTYDALGRLVRTQLPHPDPQTSAGQLRSERFYYDGVRRIQEVFVDPLDDMDEALGDPQGSSLVLQTLGAETYELDGKSAPAVFEMAQTGEDDEDPGDPGDPGEPGGPDRWLDREYIWGPGDRGLDELLVQYDSLGLPSWPVQDQGNDAIALLDLGGVDGAPRVVAQWVYDPYGKVVAADTILQELPSLRVGHKGLFADRLDAGVDAPRLTANARILYHNRNRTLDPETGRFFQEDPNATALVLLVSGAHHGAALGVAINPFDFDDRFTDGANLYGYVGGNPMTNSDPMGLFIGLFVPGPADFIGGGLSSMVGEYAANQEWDVAWALDWGLPDNWHSRLDNSWVEESFARGVYASFTIDIPFTDHSFNPLDVFASARAPRGLGPMKSGLRKRARENGIGLPPFSRIQAGMREAHIRINQGGGVGELRRINDGKTSMGSSMRWQSHDGKVGFRINTPHPSHTGRKGSSWHIDWFDWRQGGRGTGGRSGEIFLDL